MSELGPRFDPGTDPQILELSSAMQNETFPLALIYSEAYANPNFVYTRPPQERLRALADNDPRLETWPDALEAGRQLAWDTIRVMDSKYWRVNLLMSRVKFDEGLPADEVTNTQILTELLLWSRITPESTGNTNYPYAASSPAIRREFEALQLELSGDDISRRINRGHLPGVTWSSTISSLFRGQVRVGRDPAA